MSNVWPLILRLIKSHSKAWYILYFYLQSTFYSKIYCDGGLDKDEIKPGFWSTYGVHDTFYGNIMVYTYEDITPNPRPEVWVYTIKYVKNTG